MCLQITKTTIVIFVIFATIAVFSKNTLKRVKEYK